MDENQKQPQAELEELLGLNRKKRSGKKIALIVVCATLIVAVVGAGIGVAVLRGKRAQASTETTYREYTVQRGDVTIGQSESSSISLNRETVTFPVSATVEEVYVKEGSSVKAGDALVKMNEEDIAAGLASYELQLNIVGLELEQAKLQQQSRLLSAEQKLESSEQSGALANATANLEIAQLEVKVEEAQEKLTEKQEELAHWLEVQPDIQDDYDAMVYYLDMQEKHDMNVDGVTWDEIVADEKEIWNEKYGAAIETPEDLEDEIALTQKELAAAELSLEQAELSLKTGKLNATQQKETSKSGADTAKSEYELTSIELEQAVEAAQETYDELASQIEEVKSLISEDGVIYAPCNGLVASISVSEGDEVEVFIDSETNIIRAYATILTMTDIAEVYVPITISEEDILDVSIGQEAHVTMTAFPNRTFAAEVDAITVESSRSGAATVSYTVNVVFSEENTLDMLEGMSAEVTLVQRAATDVLYINNQAISFEGGKSYVLIEGANGEKQKKQVVTGFTDGRYVEIVSGLSAGDTVLVESAVSGA